MNAQQASSAQDSRSTLWLLLGNGVFVSGVYAFAKVAGLDGVSALGTLAWQVLFAGVAIATVAVVRGEAIALTWTTLRYAAIAGVLGVTAPNLVTFTALAHVPAGIIGVIGALSPIFTYAIALALGIERVQPLRAFGIGLGLAGVLAILLPRGTLPDMDALWWALAAILTPLFLAGGNVFRSLAWPPGLAPLSAAGLMLLLQASLLVPLALALEQFTVPRDPWSRVDMAMAGAGLLTAAFYLGVFELQRRGGPIVVAQLGYVITVASMFIGVVVFDEKYPLESFAAAGLVLAAVSLVNLRGSTHSSGGKSRLK